MRKATGATSQMMVLFKFTAVRISNPTNSEQYCTDKIKGQIVTSFAAHARNLHMEKKERMLAV
jgi:hypothetical protein